MRLKILMVPFAILISLVLGIGFIKPDITIMQEKQAILETKLGQSNNMTTLLNNIAALGNDLDSQTESESFLADYLPKTIDQEKVIDKFNFLANQSGVFLVGISFKEAERKEAEIAPVEPVSAPLVTGGDIGVPLAPVAQPVITQSFASEVTVKGSYDNVKDFFTRVAHMNRYHQTRKFSLAVFHETGDESDSDGASTLVGIFEADFDYLPSHKVASALGEPVFMRSTLDTSSLSTVLSWVTNTVPALQSPLTGRPNPFQ